MSKYILITGVCGTGKTWVMKQLIDDYALNSSTQNTLYHWRQNDEAFNLGLVDSKIAVLGKYDGSMFEGSDRFAMNIMAKNAEVKPVLDTYDFIIAEGDRFTNQTFIKDFQPIIVRVAGDGAEGRAKRGSEQSERHIKSITTRVSNIEPDFIVKDSAECLDFLRREIAGKRILAKHEPIKTTLF